ncbi:MAG: FAD-dependent oxidoreductase, partial [Flavobacteriales bacterium]
MKNKHYDIAIIGGGIVGAASMYKLQKHYPELKILLLEKEDRLADHQTGYNSGVIHSGIYYKPGSLKALNCTKGRRELVEFAKEHGIKHDVCGKVIVATDEKEFPHLDKIYNRGLENGIEGMEWVDAEGISQIEPECKGIKGVNVPCTGIIDYAEASKKMIELAVNIQEESEYHTGEKYIGHTREGEEKVNLKTNKTNYHASHIIFCGGLHSDRLALQNNVDLK